MANQNEQPQNTAQLGQEALPENHRSGFIAVIGRPNVGKSTLLNRLLGQKIAIISPKPQTTRDAILGIRTDPDAQYIFLDTPGIHQPKHALGKWMVQVAERTIEEDADVALWLVDVNVSPTDEDRMIAQRLQEMAQEITLPTLVLGLNKVDLWSGDEQALAQRRNQYTSLLSWLISDDPAVGQPSIPAHPISATTGAGVDELLHQLRELLPHGPRFYPEDQVTDISLRFLVSEIVREKALLLLREEVPHSIAVAITDWAERENGVVYIEATIYVERDSQKGIVLGKKGATIKRIGQAARPEIEEAVGAPVYLELWVKVWPKWRRKTNMLRRLGYGE